MSYASPSADRDPAKDVTIGSLLREAELPLATDEIPGRAELLQLRTHLERIQAVIFANLISDGPDRYVPPKGQLLTAFGTQAYLLDDLLDIWSKQRHHIARYGIILGSRTKTASSITSRRLTVLSGVLTHIYVLGTNGPKRSDRNKLLVIRIKHPEQNVIGTCRLAYSAGRLSWFLPPANQPPLLAVILRTISVTRIPYLQRNVTIVPSESLTPTNCNVMVRHWDLCHHT